jgi:DNA-binding transcriptional regulator YhcF (GntR family)
MYLENGNTFRQMAQLAGVNEATIARRIYKLIQRLLDGEYITCLRNRKLFSAREMKVAKDYFLLGLSMRRIAAKRECSYYRVRQALKKIQALVQVKKQKSDFI